VSTPGGTAPAGRRALRGLPAGATLVELVLTLGLLVTITALSTPVLAASIDAGRVRQAAQFLAAQCRGARMEAITRTAAIALVFDLVDGRWRMRRCRDGNGNGVRRTEITRGRDTCPDGSVEVGELFFGVHIATDATLPDPDGGVGSADPVRFGAGDLASFTPLGTATAGTVYLRSAAGLQYAIRIAGATGRTRVLRFDASSKRWQEV
jgi:type II secretory pathway pseudopilin PulG